MGFQPKDLEYAHALNSFYTNYSDSSLAKALSLGILSTADLSYIRDNLPMIRLAERSSAAARIGGRLIPEGKWKNW